MPPMSTLVPTVAFALTAAHDIRTTIRAKKAAKESAAAKTAMANDLAVTLAQIMYLCHLLEKHEVPADEFDMIALNFNK